MNKIFIFCICVIALSCSPHLFESSSQSCLERRTDRLIHNLQEQTDTVFSYSAAFHKYNLVWFHKSNIIYCFMVKPHNTKRYKPIEEDINLNDPCLDQYFEDFLHKKDIPCFECVLDGEWISLYIKNKEPLLSSINTPCLFNTKYKPMSFPFCLQYDFFKLGISPKDFDFDKVYFKGDGM